MHALTTSVIKLTSILLFHFLIKYLVHYGFVLGDDEENIRILPHLLIKVSLSGSSEPCSNKNFLVQLYYLFNRDVTQMLGDR